MRFLLVCLRLALLVGVAQGRMTRAQEGHRFVPSAHRMRAGTQAATKRASTPRAAVVNFKAQRTEGWK